MVRSLKKFGFIAVLLLAVAYFYTPLLFSQKLPIPSDTIIGLYNPYRDFYANFYPNGIPFKNFLITDPVRQTYIWKQLAINIWESGNIPLWNPYEMAGKPLLANFQSGVFYPLNIILLFKPFSLTWSVFIMIQSILGGIFMYLYLRNLKLYGASALIGSLAFIFSGFFISWLEWGTIVSTALWLPLILFSIDKFFESFNIIKSKIRWTLLFVFALSSSFLAGHLQIFSYLYIVAIFYFFLRWFENKGNIKTLLLFFVANILFLIITFIQWFPTLQYINLSARNIDQSYKGIAGWFIPWKHLTQFVVPDFFGNPATLNYWGTWNYGEFVGFIGILPLLLSFYSLFKKRTVVTFFVVVIIVCLLFALPTGVSSLPYFLHIPFVSSAQPTRLIFLIVFSLSVLTSFGFENINEKKKATFLYILPILGFALVFLLLWFAVITRSSFIFDKIGEIGIAKRNLLYSSLIFILSSLLLSIYIIIRRRKVKQIMLVLIILITVFDLMRFAQKFTPFTQRSYLYPSTKVIDYLKKQKALFRVANLDNRIMPPNFYTAYKIQTIEGYDPLYLKTYAQFVIALERGKPDISEPYGFNRIITPHNYNSPLFDFLNTKYVLSLVDINSPKFKKVLQEGQTRLYENKDFYNRVYFVNNIVVTNNDIKDIFDNNLKTTAIVSNIMNMQTENLSIGTAKILSYSADSVSVVTENKGNGFLVMSDAYYPTWKVFIDGKQGTILKTNHSFRGVYIPKGKHTIIFKDYLF